MSLRNIRGVAAFHVLPHFSLRMVRKAGVRLPPRTGDGEFRFSLPPLSG